MTRTLVQRIDHPPVIGQETLLAGRNAGARRVFRIDKNVGFFVNHNRRDDEDGRASTAKPVRTKLDARPARGTGIPTYKVRAINHFSGVPDVFRNRNLHKVAIQGAVHLR